MVASTAPAGARVELIQREGSHSTLVARRLPTPGRDRVYQVWLKSGKAAPKPTNALFGVRPDGSASVDVPGSLKGVDAGAGHQRARGRIAGADAGPDPEHRPGVG